MAEGKSEHRGLEGFQGSRILIPTRRNLQPDREFLAERYELRPGPGAPRKVRWVPLTIER